MAIKEQDLKDRNIDNNKPLLVCDGDVVFHYDGNAVIPHYGINGNKCRTTLDGRHPGKIISEIEKLDILIEQLKTSGISHLVPNTKCILKSIEQILGILKKTETQTNIGETINLLKELERLLWFLDNNNKYISDKIIVRCERDYLLHKKDTLENGEYKKNEWHYDINGISEDILARIQELKNQGYF